MDDAFGAAIAEVLERALARSHALGVHGVPVRRRHVVQHAEARSESVVAVAFEHRDGQVHARHDVLRLVLEQVGGMLDRAVPVDRGQLGQLELAKLPRERFIRRVVTARHPGRGGVRDGFLPEFEHVHTHGVHPLAGLHTPATAHGPAPANRASLSPTRPRPRGRPAPSAGQLISISCRPHLGAGPDA